LQSNLNAAALALRPFTVVRVRGMLGVESDQIAANEQPFGAWGLAVVSDQASASLPNIPTPITDENSDLWFAYQFFATSWKFNTSGAAIMATWEFDSKAMRKVDDGQNIVSVFENASALHGLNYIIKYRLLVKLH